MRVRPFAVAALVATVSRPAYAQLSLGEALREADRNAFANRGAAAAAEGHAAQTLLPLRGILPSMRFEAGYVRTTDPIGVFGTSLRQRAVSPANFDPQRLNHPDAIGDYQGGVVIEQPLVNADAWYGRRAAQRAADAGRASGEWTRLATRADVVKAYYGIVLARQRAITLEAAANAAHAHVAQAELMIRQGLVTKSDALLASVRAGEVDAQLVEAKGGAAIARQQLAVLLGRAGDAASIGSPSVLLPAAERIRIIVSPDTASVAAAPRADLQAAERGLEAARADVARARATYLPRLNSFARVDWNSAGRLYGGDRSWTVGVMASWSVLPGASPLADDRAARARGAAARSTADAAQANARLDLEQTRIALGVALARLVIAEAAAAQSAEAERIVSRKYAGGLATVVELLDAQAVEIQSALGVLQARWSAVAAGADRRRALGRDPGSLAVLDDTLAAAPSASGASADRTRTNTNEEP